MNIQKILSYFGGWVFAGLTFLGFVIIYVGIGGRGKYRATGETNFYFVVVGIVLVLPFLVYILRSQILINKAEDKETKRVNNLIRTGDKVIVNLNNFEIQSNSYKKEVEVGSGYDTRNEYIEVNHNILILDVPYNSHVIRYRLNIDMETTKLKMHFAIKQETELYIDPENPDNNYLDLQFLES